MVAKTAIIIGAGPAGLTTATELLKTMDIKPIILEETDMVGGISRTVNYKGNRIDIGGHRFFSKSERVMQWWLKIFPLQNAPAKDDKILGRHPEFQFSEAAAASESLPRAGTFDPEQTDGVMLIRQRVSRILFLRRFFSYPISLTAETIKNLGFIRMLRIGFSYIWIKIFPIRDPKSLEEFFISRFGKELYLTFFKDYTEKVWGIPCSQIKPEWGAQRIKGLSITKALLHALQSKKKGKGVIGQKEVETSLIDQFIYPKHGPGQLWEAVAEDIQRQGGCIQLNHRVKEVYWDDKISGVKVVNTQTGEETFVEGDYFISSMPVRDLVKGLGEKVPDKVKEVAEGLHYRDFMTVGLLLNKLKIKNQTGIPTVHNIVPDNWIYIQERDVRIGRMQIFNNWSPYMVKDPSLVWIGLEYFCNEGDELWNMSDAEFIRFAIDEMVKINVIEAEDVLDGTVIRIPKAYPAYFGSYDEFDTIRNFVDAIPNLFLIGRNGMHRYNNMDHSMLTAMEAVESIKTNRQDKSWIWNVNVEQEYHESKS